MAPCRVVGLLVVLLPALEVASTTVHVKDGRVVDSGKWVGNHTSQLNQNVLPLFPTVSSADWQNNSMINATTKLRYLILEGDYLADVPLALPSLFVLLLSSGSGATIKPATNLSLENTTTFTGLVQLHDVAFSAVIGGTVDASSLPAEAYDYPYRRGYMAIAIQGGHHNAVRRVQARSNNSDGAVGINQSPRSEIAHCDLGGGAGGQGLTKGRCVWCLATSNALVHDNWIRNCSAHSLDFDAYTSASAAYNNLCEDGTEEGIFVEETASGNFVFNNTIRRCGSGVGVYSNAVGPVANNMVIGNRISDVAGNAITAGGFGHVATKTSSHNIFASNVATNNKGHDGGQFMIHHGATLGDFWTNNVATTDDPLPGQAAAYTSWDNSSEVVVFDPEPAAV